MSSAVSASLPVHLVSSTRVFPADHKPSSAQPTTVTPLSIMDNKSDGFGSTGVVWLYESDARLAGGGDKFIPAMIRSLSVSLSSFPFWCGTLYRCPLEGSADSAHSAQLPDGLPRHCVRFGRCLLMYGTQSDPGVALLVAECPLPMAGLVPTTALLAGKGVWRCQALAAGDLCRTTPLFPSDEWPSTTSLPSMVVQLTTFACGGRAVAVRLAHVLADVQTISTFAHHWSAVHRAMLADQSCITSTAPVFDPQLLDRQAAGDIDATHPDKHLLSAAHCLPQEHWDKWASNAGCPAVLAEYHTVPSGVNRDSIAEPGQVIDWVDWDFSVPNEYAALHFAADELQRMRLDATSPTLRPTTLRALSAHLWRVICTARGLAGEESATKFVCYVGLRPKLPTPLPASFLGSPTLEATTLLSAATVCAGPLADVAAAIDHSLHRFDAATLPALLHAFAFEDHPNRWSHGMFGRNHVLLTSWQHLSLYDVQFIPGHSVRYVDGVFDDFLDGLVTVMEAGSGSGDVLVQLRLQPAAMKNVLSNPDLRRYRHTRR